jgi:hypothetical protein
MIVVGIGTDLCPCMSIETMIGPIHNNAIKFSSNKTQCLGKVNKLHHLNVIDKCRFNIEEFEYLKLCMCRVH